MTHRELILYCLTLGFESILCLLVYLRGVHRRLPSFTAYVSVLLIDTLAFQLVYHHFGFRSFATYYIGWMVIGVNAIARSFAVGELCWYGLRLYRGIWALAWRVLTLLAALFLGHAALDAWGQPNWFATYVLTIERDIEIASIVILVALFLIRNYYGLPLESLQSWIAVGILFYCTADAVGNTMLRDFFTTHMLFWTEMKSQVEWADELWNTIRTSAFIVSMSIWCFALLRPLPATAEDPVLLPAQVYNEMSPAINLRLRAFNDRLLELLRS